MNLNNSIINHKSKIINRESWVMGTLVLPRRVER